MSVPAKLVAAILAGPLPPKPYVAALPMYDWPEVRAEVDAQWLAIRDELRKKDVEAPERLARRNADLPPVPGGIRDGLGKVIAPDPANLPPDEFDLAVLWQHPNLLLSQACWGPLELWLRGVRMVGQEDYSGIEGGEGEMYSSAIVMRRGFRPLPAVGLSGLRLAYNAPDSKSGYLALKRDLEAKGSGLQIFSEQIETGSHRNSLRAVCRGMADVAAIDCKTWALAQEFEAAARELALVGWTQRRKGLPFVTAGNH
jgi:ABC-type phosphate/phosphonate transport system substrate-binding protein